MKYTQRDLRKTEEKTNYTISLPSELYQRVKDFAYQNNQSIAYTFQTAIEEHLEKYNNKEK